METQLKTAYFGMGCFWCAEAVFQRINGVMSVISGYSGGTINNPSYQKVSTGSTGHAEVAQIQFDSRVISYETLVEIFFAFHDPTQLNRQGNDVGTQYRSVIFYLDQEQKQIAQSVRDDLRPQFSDPIVTELTRFTGFYPADSSHQDFYNSNPDSGYCRVIIDPKIAKLRAQYSHLMKSK